MKHLGTYILFIVCIALAYNTHAQDNMNQLALLYYSQQEYEKATDIYLNLYKQTHSQTHFDYLLDCLVQTNKLDEAKKIIEEQISFFPNNYYYILKLAWIYHTMQNEKLYLNTTQKASKKALRNKQETIEYIDACIANSLINAAIEHATAAQKKYADYLPLLHKQIMLYAKVKNYNEMATNIIHILLTDPNEIEPLTAELRHTIFEQKDDTFKNTLRKKILAAINEYPKESVFSEFLLWMYLQENNVQQAEAIARSIDTRKKENGQRVMDVGNIALNDKQYSIASSCFSYVAHKGKESPYYVAAINMLLEAGYMALIENSQPDMEQIKKMEQQFIDYSNELGRNAQSIKILRNLAYLQGFYLQKTTEAIELLQEALTIRGVSQLEKGLCSLLLADLQLYANDIWGANILYAKITLDYKNSDTGHQARYKQAQIAYYNGQFEYAQMLLDVLKASTTKLIANDAFELSHLITENTLMDSTATALSYFAKADLLLYQNKPNEAFAYLDSITTQFPGHSIESELLMRKAVVSKKNNNPQEMIAYLTEITQRFSYDIHADKAHFMLAEYYELNEKDIEKAQEHYKIILLEYPQSFYNTIARKKFREMQKL